MGRACSAVTVLFAEVLGLSVILLFHSDTQIRVGEAIVGKGLEVIAWKSHLRRGRATPTLQTNITTNTVQTSFSGFPRDLLNLLVSETLMSETP